MNRTTLSIVAECRARDALRATNPIRRVVEAVGMVARTEQNKTPGGLSLIEMR